MKATNSASVSKSAPPDKKKWGVWPCNEKTFKAMFKLFCSNGRTGPLQMILFSHAVTNNRPQPRYTVQKSIVEQLSAGRIKHGYDFYAFSKLPRDTWALFNEGKKLHVRVIQKTFDGSAVYGNRRIQAGKLTESRR